MMVVSVVVDIKVHQVDQTYDYLVPTLFEDVIEVGMRVIVPFGNRNVMAYVLDIKSQSTFDKLKPIKRIVDLLPSLTPELIRLAQTLSYQNISPLVSNLQAMLPSALKSNYTKRLYCEDLSALPETIKQFFKNQQVIKLSQVDETLQSTVKRLVKSGALRIETKITQKNTKQFIDYLILITDDIPVRGSKQQAVIDYLKTHGRSLKKEVMDDTKAAYSTIKSLQDKNIIQIEAIEFYRDIETITKPLDKDITLHSAQQTAYQAITDKRHQYDVFLLHGVTGSGKTEIYLNVIEDVVNDGLDAILLVPEISLTPMMISRFRGRFKENVAVLHSHLSIGEKYDEWRKIRRHEVQVVVGARSAIFAPFENL
ncbi:MAG: DEAD/DEAH box helicase family protein, partial [Candidatus Izimaplasma sp.]|nr:DEAD/DEAH box helicase family protein [Candidatus Izimaplasma bacterium]